MKIPFAKYSEPEKITGNEIVILIDTIGFLNTCYQLSDLAIVAGSFTPKIGGHNVLEPVFAGTPVFFGPYMFSQEELKKITLQNKCAKQIDLNEIRAEIENYFKGENRSLKENCKNLTKALSGQLEKTYRILKNILVNKSS